MRVAFLKFQTQVPKKSSALFYAINPSFPLIFFVYKKCHVSANMIIYLMIKFLFPNTTSVVSKHTAIVCLNSQFYLDDTAISRDERCVVASVKDIHHSLVCKVASIYAPAQWSERPTFFSSFISLPFFQNSLDEQWIFLGDFNMSLKSTPISTNAMIVDWFIWLQKHFYNCFPAGLPTYTRPNTDSRTTIDYIFGHTSLSTRLSNGLIHKVPASYTDHCLLTIDLTPNRDDVGPGSWRFNPTLLQDKRFTNLLLQSVNLFFTQTGGVSNSSVPGRNEPLFIQKLWETFKSMLKVCAQQYTKGSKSRKRNKIAILQKKRMLACQNRSESPDVDTTTSNTMLNDLDKEIDQQIQQETKECMLRSATRWHEHGERNNRYFYNVIKERQSHQTIQALKCSETGNVLLDSPSIVKEARAFYQKLYTPTNIYNSDINYLLKCIRFRIDHFNSDSI